MQRDIGRDTGISAGVSSPEGVGHTTKGTAWGANAASIYAAVKHGPDGARFLDPYLVESLFRDLAGKNVIDIGCGAGYWAVQAALNGAAKVEALDIQKPMVETALREVATAKVDQLVNISVGDAANLDYEANKFDRAISINVGCNLPKESFELHFEEMHRVLKPGGIAIVTAPASMGVVFTDGTSAERDIADTLAAIGFSTKSENVLPHLNGLTHIYRASFVADDRGAVSLMDPSNPPNAGDPIWRKLPGLAVPNRYHHEQEYEKSAVAAGFNIGSLTRACFNNEQERQQYNKDSDLKMQLGPEYVGQNPFIVLVLVKPSTE